MTLPPIIDLFNELEQISIEHEELTDTDVRECLHLTLNYYFVWGRDRTLFPRTFRMFTRAADLQVAAVVRRFLDAVASSHHMAGAPMGQARLDLLQADTERTTGGLPYDVFIGHVGVVLPPEPLPEDMFEEPEYGDDAA